MLFKNITILDRNFEIKTGKFVGTRDGRITYIGDKPPAESRSPGDYTTGYAGGPDLGEEDFGEVYDGAGKLLMPAFFNAHSHIPMALLRGYAENMNLQDWLNTRIFPFESKLTPQDVYQGSVLGIAEMLRFGIVSTSDMYYHGEDMCRAFLESGAKCNLSVGTLCFDDSDYKALHTYEAAKYLFEHYHGANDGSLAIDLSIHGEYTSTPKVVSQLSDYAKETGMRVQVHVSETKKEHEDCKQRREGRTPVRYLDDMGLFDGPATAAHCVWVEPEDQAILAEKGVTVATCPKSNLKLASGICDVPGLLSRGVRVAIGTDGAASNNNLNMLEEIKFFALIHKENTMDPTVITPAQALAAATVSGAASQGRQDSGLIAEGYRADLIVLSTEEPYMRPLHNMINNIVYSAVGTDVCLTMANGKVLYKDGVYHTIDIEQAIWNGERIRERILGELS